jgi:ectoine hydroxylase-related dioxygenase (phytanoyl-CoA dioxygenase family)
MEDLAGHPLDTRAYESQGYMVFDPEFSPDLIASVRSEVRGLLDAQLLKWKNAVRKPYRESDADLHLKSRAAADLISHDAFFDLALTLIGRDADLRFSITMTKTADHGEPLDWHQDWGLDQDRGHHRISCWVAITRADVGNGCVWVIPGSHKGPLLEHKVSETHPPDRGIMKLDASGAIPVELKAGQVLVLHPQVIHGSGRNVSGKERMAVTMSYQTPKPQYDVRWAGAGMRFIKDGRKTWEPLAVTD